MIERGDPMSTKRSILIPNYLQTFACIGGDCEDTCCIGFRVELDQHTYESYKKIEDPDLQADVNKYVQPITEQQTEKRYGYIEKQDDGRCSFLNESNLCKLHLRHGSSALGLICHTYPRMVNFIDDAAEQSATISCPEIARLALLNKNGIQFIESEIDADERHNIGLNIDSKQKSTAFWELRLFSLNTLQDRQYTVAERLLILAMFFQKVDAVVQSGHTDTLKLLTEQYDSLSQSGAFKQALQKMPVNPEWKYSVLGQLLHERKNFTITNDRFRVRFEKAVKQLGLESKPFQTNHYIENEAFWEAAFTNQYDYIFENYLVNQAYRSVFPFRGYRNFSEEFLMLAIHYACIRLMAIGLASTSSETFNEHELVAWMQTYSKEVEHHAIYIKFMYDALKLNDCTNLAKLSMLLKGL
jgi:lysine-N-methylase